MRRLAALALIALAGLMVVVPTAEAQGGATATVEVRVWQNVGDLEDIRISARPAGGDWRILGTIPLPLDETSDSGTYRYGNIDLDVPLPYRTSPATVEVRVWQRLGANERVYISARPAGGDWGVLGTIRLLLDDGFSSSGTFQFGDIRLDVPVPGGGVTTLAGAAGDRGYSDGRGDEARFGAGGRVVHYLGLAVDVDGSVVVADGRAIRRIQSDGTVTTVAGGSTHGNRDGPAATARFDDAIDVAIDGDGAIYVADCLGRRIRKISPEGMVTTAAGAEPPVGASDYDRDGPAVEAVFGSPCGLALAPDGGLYIMERWGIRHLSRSGWVSTFAEGGGDTELDGPKANIGFRYLRDIDVDADGNVYVLDGHDYHPNYSEPSYLVRKISTDGWVSTVFRSDTSAEGLLVSPGGLAVTAEGEVYLSNTARHQIVRVVDRDTLVAVAGTGVDGYLDGSRDEARFSWPGALAVAPGGALVVTDQDETIVRVAFPDAERGFTTVPLAPVSELARLEGVHVRVLAGSFDGFADGVGGEARFSFPDGLALDAGGNVIVADSSNDAIRRVAPDGTVTTLAGGSGRGLLDGSGSEALFANPTHVAFAADGFIYVVDRGNGLLRRVGPDGTVGPGWEGEPAISPRALVAAPDGSLIVSEGYNPRVLRIAPDGAVSIVLPTGYRGLTFGLAADADGNVFWVDEASPGETTALRRVDRDGAVTTLLQGRAGTYGGVFSRNAADLTLAPDGTLYLTDENYRRVLQVAPDGDVSIVASWPRGRAPSGIVITPEGSLIVSDRQRHVIYEITFENRDEALK